MKYGYNRCREDKRIEIEERAKYPGNGEVTSTKKKITNSVITILVCTGVGVLNSALIYKGGKYLYEKHLEITKDTNKELLNKAKSESLSTLKKYGFELKFVQFYVELIGGYKLKHDGIFGEETKKAVEVYQSKKGISVDGSIGDETIMHLILDGFCDNETCYIINRNIVALTAEFKKIGVEVEGLQKVLKDDGYYDKKVDGQFGLNTYKAILKLIIKKNLNTDPINEPFHAAYEIKKALGIIDQ